jgi:hypothetical protein
MSKKNQPSPQKKYMLRSATDFVLNGKKGRSNRDMIFNYKSKL